MKASASLKKVLNDMMGEKTDLYRDRSRDRI